MRILNLIHDEKFIDGLISEFDYFNLCARFVVLQNRPLPLRYIKKVNRVEVITVNGVEYEELLSAEQYDVLWIHFLDATKITFVNSLKPDVRKRILIGWSSWGGDLYGLLDRFFLMPWTFFTWLRYSTWGSRLKNIVNLILGRIGFCRGVYNLKIRKCLRQMDFVSTIVPQEWRYVKRLIRKDAQFVRFYYASLPCMPLELEPVDLSSLRIWLGNSATYSNNYFDVFKRIRGLSQYEIQVPLSYGNEAEIIDEEGKITFGDKWNPVRNFLDYNEYVKEMSKSAIFIFAHLRQQALGNVLIALKMGGCVFMDFRNPLVAFLRQYDVKIYSINDLPYRLEECLKEFGDLQMENIRKAKNIHSEAEIVNGLGLTFSALTNLMNERISG